MSINPYESPTAKLTKESNSAEIPEKILKKIKLGWKAGILSGFMTFVLLIIARNTGFMKDQFNLSTSFDVLFFFILTICVYEKSRISSTLVFLLFCGFKLWFVVQTGKLGSLAIGIPFSFFYLQAVVGTYQYHSLLQKS